MINWWQNLVCIGLAAIIFFIFYPFLEKIGDKLIDWLIEREHSKSK